MDIQIINGNWYKVSYKELPVPCKIGPLNPEASRVLQKELFKRGYSWTDGKFVLYTEAKYLCIRRNFKLMHSDTASLNGANKLHTYQEFTSQFLNINNQKQNKDEKDRIINTVSRESRTRGIAKSGGARQITTKVRPVGNSTSLGQSKAKIVNIKICGSSVSC